MEMNNRCFSVNVQINENAFSYICLTFRLFGLEFLLKQIIRIVFMTTTTTLMQNFITFHEWEVGFLESTEKAVVNLKNMTVKVSLMFVWKKDKSFVHFRSNRLRMQSFSCGIRGSYKVSKTFLA